MQPGSRVAATSHDVTSVPPPGLLNNGPASSNSTHQNKPVPEISTVRDHVRVDYALDSIPTHEAISYINYTIRNMRGSTAAAVFLRWLQTSAKCARSASANQARGSTKTLCGARLASSAPLLRHSPIKNTRKYSQARVAPPRGAFVQLRSLATEAGAKVDGGGPLTEYDRRVEAGELQNDEHQRGKIYSEP